MDIEQIIVRHFYNSKRIDLQGIGTFRLNAGDISTHDIANKANTSLQNITFEYDPKVTEDSSLIDAIVKDTKKMKPLASADLNSYLILSSQLLNLGIPLILPGLGTLDKSKPGDIIFIPGLTNFAEPPPQKNIKNYHFPDYYQVLKKQRKKKILLVVPVILSFGIVYLISGYFGDRHIKNENSVSKVDKPISRSAKALIQKDKLQQPDTKDDYSFRIIFYVTPNKDDALNILFQINGFGHSAIIYPADSLYEVGMPFNLPLKDTSYIKDSLDQFYSLGKGIVEIKK